MHCLPTNPPPKIQPQPKTITYGLNLHPNYPIHLHIQHVHMQTAKVAIETTNSPPLLPILDCQRPKLTHPTRVHNQPTNFIPPTPKRQHCHLNKIPKYISPITHQKITKMFGNNKVDGKSQQMYERKQMKKAPREFWESTKHAIDPRRNIQTFRAPLGTGTQQQHMVLWRNGTITPSQTLSK